MEETALAEVRGISPLELRSIRADTNKREHKHRSSRADTNKHEHRHRSTSTDTGA